MHDYALKFTQLSGYATKIVKEIRSRISFFVANQGRSSSKEGRETMLMGDMDI